MKLHAWISAENMMNKLSKMLDGIYGFVSNNETGRVYIYKKGLGIILFIVDGLLQEILW